MNGNRIVITDLGNSFVYRCNAINLGRQTLTLVVLSPDETKAAEIHKTEPLHWTDKQVSAIYLLHSPYFVSE